MMSTPQRKEILPVCKSIKSLRKISVSSLSTSSQWSLFASESGLISEPRLIAANYSSLFIRLDKEERIGGNNIDDLTSVNEQEYNVNLFEGLIRNGFGPK